MTATCGELPRDHDDRRASKAGGFLGVMGRWTARNGVAAFLNANSSSIGELYVMDANNYLANAVAVTADSAIPASWTNSGVDSTMAVEFCGLHRERVPRRGAGRARDVHPEPIGDRHRRRHGRRGNSRRVRSIAVTGLRQPHGEDLCTDRHI